MSRPSPSCRSFTTGLSDKLLSYYGDAADHGVDHAQA